MQAAAPARRPAPLRPAPRCAALRCATLPTRRCAAVQTAGRLMGALDAAPLPYAGGATIETSDSFHDVSDVRPTTRAICRNGLEGCAAMISRAVPPHRHPTAPSRVPARAPVGLS